MTVTAASTIARTLEGFVDHLHLLESAADPGDREIDVRSWNLNASAVRRIIEQYISGSITANQARDWAFFVRHGYAESSALPVAPIDISWERMHEDAIAEATMRLEELGDIVDGVLAKSEAELLIRSLTA